MIKALEQASEDRDCSSLQSQELDQINQILPCDCFGILGCF